MDIAARFPPMGTVSAFAWLGLLPMAARVSFGGGYYSAAKHLLAAATVVPLFVLIIRRGKGDMDGEKSLSWIAWAAIYAA